MKKDVIEKTEPKRLERGLEPEIEDIVIGALQRLFNAPARSRSILQV